LIIRSDLHSSEHALKLVEHVARARPHLEEVKVFCLRVCGLGLDETTSQHRDVRGISGFNTQQRLAQRDEK
jgi:hypothetical protein